MDAQNAKLVTIIGGSGFLGTQLVQEMARKGYRIRVGVRRPDLAGHLRPLGTVGQIQPIQVNVRNFESVARAAQGSDIVINVAGIGIESGRNLFRAVNTMGAANVAKACAQHDVAQLIHISALGADENSPSSFARSKALGEQEVLAAFPSALIMRPSIMFGQDDKFFNLFGMFARVIPVMPVFHPSSLFQPIYVGDVAQAIEVAAQGGVKGGKIYELGGPDIESMKVLMQRILDISNRTKSLFQVPIGLAKFKAGFLQILPEPMLTVDQLLLWEADNKVSEVAVVEKRTLRAFGLVPESMDEVLPTYMWRFRKHGQFEKIQA